jgi:parallel beta-helix repeat protein
MRKLLAALAAVSVAILIASPAQAATIVVSPGQSIQAAIDAANPGDTIVVEPGTYNQNVLIAKNGITLEGRHAILEPPVGQPACVDPEEPESLNGICVFGEPDAHGNITPVQGVTVTGFTIRNFSGSGIIAFGAEGATFSDNTAADNGEYGIAAFNSTGTKILGNTTYGSEEAGVYVGDSPNADATIRGNETFDNLFGIFLRNAENGAIRENNSHDNCIGALVLADAPGPAGGFTFVDNNISHNTKACPPIVEEDFPPTSGVGIALLGAHDVRVVANTITDNIPSGPTAFSAGVFVATGVGGTKPANIVVTHNAILRNQPDLFWDGEGSGIDLTGNWCETSVPPGLCS